MRTKAWAASRASPNCCWPALGRPGRSQLGLGTSPGCTTWTPERPETSKEVDRPVAAEPDRRLLEPMFGLVLGAEHPFRLRDQLGELPGTPALLGAEGLGRLLGLAPLEGAKADPHGFLERVGVPDHGDVL